MQEHMGSRNGDKWVPENINKSVISQLSIIRTYSCESTSLLFKEVSDDGTISMARENPFPRRTALKAPQIIISHINFVEGFENAQKIFVPHDTCVPALM